MQQWVRAFEIPTSVWLPGLTNPVAFLTAIQQATARREQLPLDNMTVETHVTTMMEPRQALDYPEDGSLVHGLRMEGARWATRAEDTTELLPYEVAGLRCAGFIRESRLKQLLPPMPLILVRAVPVDPSWEPSSVGYLRNDPTVYEAPVYQTTARGGTYVTLATLRCDSGLDRVVLAGVALVMQADE